MPNALSSNPISGLPEEDKVQTPAFTDAVRLYRQAQGHYGTWEMMCGAPSQVSGRTFFWRQLASAVGVEGPCWIFSLSDLMSWSMPVLPCPTYSCIKETCVSGAQSGPGFCSSTAKLVFQDVTITPYVTHQKHIWFINFFTPGFYGLN